MDSTHIKTVSVTKKHSSPYYQHTEFLLIIVFFGTASGLWHGYFNTCHDNFNLNQINMTIMKKVMMLAVVAALIGLSAPQVSAQVPSSTQGTSTQPDDRQSTQPSDRTTTQPDASQPSTGTSTGTGTSKSSDAHKADFGDEIQASDLPAAVTRALNEKYPGYTTDKAYRGKDGTYKIKVSKGDEKQTLFLDARGESVKSMK